MIMLLLFSIQINYTIQLDSNKLKMFSEFSKILMILISLQEMCQTVMLKEQQLKRTFIESPSPQEALCQVWLKLAPVFHQKILKIVSVGLYIDVVVIFS